MTETEAILAIDNLFARLDEPNQLESLSIMAHDVYETLSITQDQLSEEPLKRVKLEYDALSVVIRSNILGAAHNGSRLCDIEKITPELIEYIKSRADSTGNPIISAHYHDILWEKQRIYPGAISAIDKYLITARKLFTGSDELYARFYACAALDHAACLALAVNNEQHLKLIISETHSYFTDQVDSVLKKSDISRPFGRFVADLADIVMYLRDRLGVDYIDDNMITYVKESLVSLADFNSQAGDFDSEQEFLRRAARAARINLDDSSLFKLHIREGESLEQEARSRIDDDDPSHLAAAWLYENALVYYEHLMSDTRTSPEQREDLKNRIINLKRHIRKSFELGRNEMGIIQEKLELPSDEVEELLHVLLEPANLLDCLKMIASEGSLLPNVVLADEQALIAAKTPRLFDQMPRILISDNSPVAKIQGINMQAANATTEGSLNEPYESEAEAVNDLAIIDTDWYAAERDRNLLMWINIQAVGILTPLFKRLKDRGLDADILMEYISNCEFIDESGLYLMKVGFERYFAGDYISAIHILVPHYEDALRSLFELAGMPIINHRRGDEGWQFETNFGDIMKYSADQQIMPIEIREYNRLVLADVRGWNIRNRVAHGLIRPNECVEPVAATLLHLFLILSQFRYVPEPETEGEFE